LKFFLCVLSLFVFVSCSSIVSHKGCYKSHSYGGPYQIEDFDKHTVNVPVNGSKLADKIYPNDGSWKPVDCK